RVRGEHLSAALDVGLQVRRVGTTRVELRGDGVVEGRGATYQRPLVRPRVSGRCSCDDRDRADSRGVLTRRAVHYREVVDLDAPGALVGAAPLDAVAAFRYRGKGCGKLQGVVCPYANLVIAPINFNFDVPPGVEDDDVLAKDIPDSNLSGGCVPVNVHSATDARYAKALTCTAKAEAEHTKVSFAFDFTYY